MKRIYGTALCEKIHAATLDYKRAANFVFPVSSLFHELKKKSTE